MAATTSPLADDDASPLSRGDVEAALAAGSVTPEQAIALLEQKLEKLEAKLEEFGFEARVRSVVARLTETPTSFHQGTVFYAACHDEGEDMETRRRYLPCMLLTSVFMVLAQCAVVSSILVGTVYKSCGSSEQCLEGYYCGVGQRERCELCGDRVPLMIEYGEGCVMKRDVGDRVDCVSTVPDPTGVCKTWNRPWDENNDGFSTTAVERLCREPVASIGLDGAGSELGACRAAAAPSEMLPAEVHGEHVPESKLTRLLRRFSTPWGQVLVRKLRAPHRWQRVQRVPSLAHSCERRRDGKLRAALGGAASRIADDIDDHAHAARLG